MGVFIEHKEDLRQILGGLKSQGKRVVMTNGAFDILHVGHIRSLRDAKSRGDFLVVALNSDTSVLNLKGPGHPIQSFAERMEILCAVDCVDYVTVLEEERADGLLDFLRPTIHAKGTDYTEETVPERDTVLGYGGAIAIVGDPKDHSTSSLIDRIGRLFTRQASPNRAAAGVRQGPVRGKKKGMTPAKKKPVKKAAPTAKKGKAKTAKGKPVAAKRKLKTEGSAARTGRSGRAREAGV